MNGMFTAAELGRLLGIPGVARVSEGNSGLVRVQITGAFGEGEMYLHGAHVTSWKPAGNEEVLFVSTKSRRRPGNSRRNSDLFSLVPRQVGRPGRPARTRAYKNVADRVHH